MCSPHGLQEMYPTRIKMAKYTHSAEHSQLSPCEWVDMLSWKSVGHCISLLRQP